MPWSIVVALISGFVIGKFRIIPTKLQSYTDHLITFGVLLLLFSMGIEMGLNKEIIKKLPYLGWQAFVLAFFAVLFSIAILQLFISRLFKVDNTKEDDSRDMATHS